MCTGHRDHYFECILKKEHIVDKEQMVLEEVGEETCEVRVRVGGWVGDEIFSTILRTS